MGKAQKIKVSKKNQVTSVAPLGEQLDTTEFAAPTGRVKERSRRDEDEDYVESRLSKNIITQARIQVNISQKYTFNLATYDVCLHAVVANISDILYVLSWLSQRSRTSYSRSALHP